MDGLRLRRIVVNQLLIRSATGASDGLMPGSAMLALTEPSRLWSRVEVLTRPCPVPKSPGVYAWYFRAPAGVPLEGCIRHGDLALL